MKIAVYPGTFDPPTNGHLDIIYRAADMFDMVIVAVSDTNTSKKTTFSAEERIFLLQKLTKKTKKIRIGTFNGLLVDYVKSVKATVIIRGLRAVSDFDYEFQMALMNRKLGGTIETVFLMPDERYTYLSSSLVKEIVALGGNVRCLVPEIVAHKLAEKYGNENRRTTKKVR
jgi:pantetheine-phosphate adenylyltransferase